METAVTKLETLFQKAESDLDYIRHRLEFEILKGLPDDLAPEENPVALLEEIAAVKSRYKVLCMQMKKVFTEQREAIRRISAALVNTMKIVRVLKQHAGLECLPLSAEEQDAALQLTCQAVELLVEECPLLLCHRIPCFLSLYCHSSIIFGIYKHCLNRRAALSVLEMNKMNVKATDSRIQILKELATAELDKQGNVELVV